MYSSCKRGEDSPVGVMSRLVSTHLSISACCPQEEKASESSQARKKKPPPTRPRPYASHQKQEQEKNQGTSQPLLDLSSWETSAQPKAAVPAIHLESAEDILKPTLVVDHDEPRPVTENIPSAVEHEEGLTCPRPEAVLMEDGEPLYAVPRRVRPKSVPSQAEEESREKGTVWTEEMATSLSEELAAVRTQEMAAAESREIAAGENLDAEGDESRETELAAQYRAIYDFDASDSSEVSFRKGDLIVPVPGSEPSHSWVLVRVGGAEGWAPDSYLEPVEGGGATEEEGGGATEDEGEKRVIVAQEETSVREEPHHEGEDKDFYVLYLRVHST